MTYSINDSDVVVCGAGLVGLAAVVALARRGQRVGLLGPAAPTPPTDRNTYCPRVYALSPASHDFLARIGVWRTLPAERIAVVKSMDIYGDADGRVQLHAWQAARAELSWIVESSEIERALTQAVHILGIPWLQETCTWERGAGQDATQGELLTAGGRRLSPSLIVAADGARSRLRAAAGLTMTSKPYGATGLIAHANAERAHGGTAFQWFRDDGVLALLPMPDTDDGPQVSIVWSMKDESAQALLAMDPQTQGMVLSRRLREATAGRLGGLRARTPLQGFALTLDSAAMVAPGMALVGDAAHRVHPLAGQGLNLGLGDVEALTEVVAGREAFRSPGDPAVLRRYRRARAEPVLAMKLATDGLARLFDSDLAPFAWLRNAGMRCVDALPLVKRCLIERASQ